MDVEVHVEQGNLGEGNPLVYRDFGCRVRMAFDPKQITEDAAITLLHLFHPRTVGAAIIHRTGS